MDPLHLCIALGPLAAYLLLIGMVNLSPRPLITTGGRDLSALSVAVAGLVVVGPMELFMPQGAADRFGGMVWLLLLALYSLIVSLLVLLARPRLVIYNITLEQLRAVMAGVVSQLDHDARWAGENLVMPQMRVQLHIEAFPALRNVQLVATGPAQSYTGWRRLETALAQALREVRCGPSPYGLGLVAAGLACVATIGYLMFAKGDVLAQALKDMLRL